MSTLNDRLSNLTKRWFRLSCNEGEVSTSNPLPVTVVAEGLGEGLLFGDLKTDVGVVPAPLVALATPCVEVLVQADPDNTQDVYVGGEDDQPIRLIPGDNVTIPTDDVMKVYVATTASTATARWLARI